jgi:hypothetical protein
MNQDAGIIREEIKLQHGLKRILELNDEFYYTDNISKEFKIDHDNDENIFLTWEVKLSLVVCESNNKKCPCEKRKDLTTGLIFQK